MPDHIITEEQMSAIKADINFVRNFLNDDYEKLADEVMAARADVASGLGLVRLALDSHPVDESRVESAEIILDAGLFKLDELLGSLGRPMPKKGDTHES